MSDLWLPKTGQTVSYPAGDNTDRDDGWYEAGSPVVTRFVDNGNAQKSGIDFTNPTEEVVA